jgi:pimeloyl-ACP methyl ester carboxylesterase
MATFCLMHGAWHDPTCWDDLVAGLCERGHTALTPDLPFDDPSAGFDERVIPALRMLDDARDPVVVVGHSLGSAYAPLVAIAHPGALLVHLCPRLGPFQEPPGAPARFRQGIPFPAERPDGTTAWDPDVAIEVLYRRLTVATARRLAARLRPLAPAVGEYPLQAHPPIPTALVYTADDEIFEPEWERFMATRLLGVEPIEIPGGHFPMLEDPDGLAGLCELLAERADSMQPR